MRRRFWLALPCGLLAGCSLISPADPPVSTALSVPAVTTPNIETAGPQSEGVQQTAYQESTKSDSAKPSEKDAAEPSTATLPAPTPVSSFAAATQAPPPLPFEGMRELPVDVLVGQVLARNPSLAQMVAAWEAAQARYPQVTSLDDPEFALTLGPHTYFSDRVNPAYRFNLQQKYPWPGKLRLRGDQAQAEAQAAGNDVDDVRLRLIESARLAFYDYYLVHRALTINAEAIRLLEEFKGNAKTRYKVARGEQQDILLADVELGRTRERGLLLEQARQIAVARINTLLNLPPNAPLPPPPPMVRVEDGLPPVETLRAAALNRRPDLKAVARRIDAEQAALALANKEFYPDFVPFAMYDRFMGNNFQSQPLAMMVGTSVNLPVRLERRRAAVREAQARINQRRAELAELVNQVNFQVQQAYAQVEQGKKAVRLYEQSVLSAAELNVKSTQAAYITGKVPFLTLIEAERQVIGLRDRYYELIAEYYRRLATLERAIGGPLTADAPTDPSGTSACPAPCRNRR